MAENLLARVQGDVLSLPSDSYAIDIAELEGSLWVLTRYNRKSGGELFRIDPVAMKVETRTELPELPLDVFLAVAPGSVWVATRFGPVLRVDASRAVLVTNASSDGFTTIPPDGVRPGELVDADSRRGPFSDSSSAKSRTHVIPCYGNPRAWSPCLGLVGGTAWLLRDHVERDSTLSVAPFGPEDTALVDPDRRLGLTRRPHVERRDPRTAAVRDSMPLAGRSAHMITDGRELWVLEFDCFSGSEFASRLRRVYAASADRPEIHVPVPVSCVDHATYADGYVWLVESSELAGDVIRMELATGRVANHKRMLFRSRAAIVARGDTGWITTQGGVRRIRFDRGGDQSRGWRLFR